MDQQTAYGLDRINKIYRIEGLDAGLSLCVRPASTPYFRFICKYSTILPSKMKFSQSLPPGIPVMAGISTAVALVSYAFGYLLR